MSIALAIGITFASSSFLFFFLDSSESNKLQQSFYVYNEPASILPSSFKLRRATGAVKRGAMFGRLFRGRLVFLLFGIGIGAFLGSSITYTLSAACNELRPYHKRDMFGTETRIIDVRSAHNYVCVYEFFEGLCYRHFYQGKC